MTEPHVCTPPDIRFITTTRWTCPVDEIRWVLVKRLFGGRLIEEWRKLPGQPSEVEQLRARVAELESVFEAADEFLGAVMREEPTSVVQFLGLCDAVEKVHAAREGCSEPGCTNTRAHRHTPIPVRAPNNDDLPDGYTEPHR
jgi:hypothetical protein